MHMKNGARAKLCERSSRSEAALGWFAASSVAADVRQQRGEDNDVDKGAQEERAGFLGFEKPIEAVS